MLRAGGAEGALKGGVKGGAWDGDGEEDEDDEEEEEEEEEEVGEAERERERKSISGLCAPSRALLILSFTSQTRAFSLYPTREKMQTGGRAAKRGEGRRRSF